MLEKDFQKKFKNEVMRILPGAVFLKNDAKYIQGFPDWIMLYNGKCAIFEIKTSEKASYQPNQQYWLDYLNTRRFFARSVYPEILGEILDEIQQTYGA